MITSERGLTVVVGTLIVGSLFLTIRNERLSEKFIDLTSTALGGYLALSIQKTKAVNSLAHSTK